MPPTFDPDGPADPDSGLFGLPHDPQEARVQILPVPFDATTSFREGAALGPEAVLAASHQVDLFDLDYGRPYEAGICMLPTDPQVERWNAEATALIESEGAREAVDRIGEELNAWVHARTLAGLEAGKLVGVLGGDHSVPFGSIRAHAERFPGLGILHIDAHADLRQAYDGFTWSHASILFNVLERIPEVATLVQCGIRDLGGEEHRRIADSPKVHTLFDRDWARAKADGNSLRELVRRTLDPLPDEVYITWDVDGLDPVLCPNTGTPVPGGFDWHGALLWLEELVASGRRIVGFDLNEVSPGPAGDPEGEGWDAIVGARLLYKLVGATLASQTASGRG